MRQDAFNDTQLDYNEKIEEIATLLKAIDCFSQYSDSEVFVEDKIKIYNKECKERLSILYSEIALKVKDRPA